MTDREQALEMARGLPAIHRRCICAKCESAVANILLEARARQCDDLLLVAIYRSVEVDELRRRAAKLRAQITKEPV